MDILHEIATTFIKDLSEIDISECGISEGLEKGLHYAKNALLKYFKYEIESLDEALAKYPKLRSDWNISRKDKRVLETECGTLEFERRYYRNRKTGEFSHLIDTLCGIPKSERVDRSLQAKICNLVGNQSYSETAKLASEGEISKQTVMNIARKVEVPSSNIEPREDVEIVHIQADEDHVSTQDGRRCQEIRLAVIHEPAMQEGKKTFLPNKMHVIAHEFNESSGVFWNRVYETLIKCYGDSLPKVYIHGDGASWIKSGLDWIPNSKFVLDQFHVSKYLSRLSIRGSSLYKQLQDCLFNRKKKEFTQLANEAIKSSQNNTELMIKARDYILKNWSGITIWTLDEESGKSCAEGLVSHCLSTRISSRPMAWLDDGAGSIARIREHLLNGGEFTWHNFPIQTEEKIIGVVESINLVDLRKTRDKSGSIDFLPEPTQKLLRTKRDAHFRIFRSVTEGGNVLFG